MGVSARIIETMKTELLVNRINQDAMYQQTIKPGRRKIIGQAIFNSTGQPFC